MNINRPKSREEYIDSLELAPRFYPELTIQDSPLIFLETGDDAKVVDGSTVSFISGIPIIKQQDVLDSTLLAQLAANKAFDREQNTIEWYEKYHEVLTNIGWIATAYNFENQTGAENTIQLDTKSLDVVRTIASGNELNILTKTLDALKNGDPAGKAVTLFEQGGSQGSGGNFQLGTASLDLNGNVVLATGAFYFSATEHQNRFLFITWTTKDINFYAGVQRIVLNENVYSSIRQSIKDKLGALAQTYVADLPI